MKKLSFCITCKNRKHQIVETLPINLESNSNDRDDIEFVLFDFGSSDGLQEWIVSSFANELEVGYLKYFYTNKLAKWHASIAKNTAHIHATGEILVNLDSDNYTGVKGARAVIDVFDHFKDIDIVVHQFSRIFRDGSCGRIAIKNSTFYKIGGYDESFDPVGFDDVDLIRRAMSSGANYINLYDNRFNKAIYNSKEEGLKHVNSSLSYDQMNSNNKNKSDKNLNSGFIVANNGEFGIREEILQYHTGKIIPIM